MLSIFNKVTALKCKISYLIFHIFQTRMSARRIIYVWKGSFVSTQKAHIDVKVNFVVLILHFFSVGSDRLKDLLLKLGFQQAIT